MKTDSLICKKPALAASAIAVSAVMAIGMAGCTSSTSTEASSSSADSSSAQEEVVSSSDAAAGTEETVASSSAASSAASTGTTAQTEAQITSDQALKTALDKAGLKESQVQIVKNYLENDDGMLKYEVEFNGPNNMEYEVEIDAMNGEVISYDSERMD